MHSSHIRTVGLCFLACKPCLFWSIIQKNSLKRVFGPSPYCYFCQSRPYVGLVFFAILLFLSVTPCGWLLCTRVRSALLGVLSSFPSETVWLSLWIFVTESRAGEGFALQCIYCPFNKDAKASDAKEKSCKCGSTKHVYKPS